VTHQRAIDADIGGLGVLPHPCGEEDVGWSDVGQRRLQTGLVKQVGGDRAQAGNIVARLARQPVDDPALIDQFGRHVAATDAACAYY
jgi:hypothetical protein